MENASVKKREEEIFRQKVKNYTLLQTEHTRNKVLSGASCGARDQNPDLLVFSNRISSLDLLMQYLYIAADMLRVFLWFAKTELFSPSFLLTFPMHFDLKSLFPVSYVSLPEGC